MRSTASLIMPLSVREKSCVRERGPSASKAPGIHRRVRGRHSWQLGIVGHVRGAVERVPTDYFPAGAFVRERFLATTEREAVDLAKFVPAG